MVKVNAVERQHGDVLFFRVDSIPAGAKEVPLTEAHCIEHGEGMHKHTLVMDAPLPEMADKIKLFEKDGTLYLDVKECINVTHEEHGTLVEGIEPGIYKKVIEREYDPVALRARNTID